MFTDINSISNLIVKLDDALSADPYWPEISCQVRCVFVYSNPNQVIKLRESVHSTAVFLEGPKNTLFGVNQLIVNALNEIGGHKYETVYVTSNFDEIDALMSEHIGTVFVGTPEPFLIGSKRGYIPDFIAKDGADLLEIVKNGIKGYLSEVLTTKIDGFRWYGNDGVLFRFDEKYEGYTFGVISGGRYFGPRHERSTAHQLSRRILKSKDDVSQNELFANVFSKLVSFVDENLELVDGITRVPPRPDERDRFKPIVELLSSQLKKLDLSSELVCKEMYPKQKQLDKEARRANVKDKFHATAAVAGKHIVLIDDVYVTGSTTLECAKTMMRKGARKITVVVLALNQLAPEWRKLVTIPCPNCNGNLVLRIAYNQTAFFGCNQWPKTKCPGTMEFLDGWHERNKLADNDGGADFIDSEITF